MRKPRPSARPFNPSNPLFPAEAALPQGQGPFVATSGRLPLVRGTIFSVDARGHMYAVTLNDGRHMQMGRLRLHPGDLTLLPAHTQVLVSFDAGMPYIIGCLPPEVASVTEETPQSVTDVPGHGGDDPVLQRNMGAASRAPGEPKDLMPGDYVGLSPDGASVAALHGQLAQLRGGPLAKVQAFGGSDKVQIIASLLRVVTEMGEYNYVNDDGKTSFIWRGGTDQLTQTGPDEEKYTIALDVGHTGDMIRLEVLNREGQSLFRFHVSATGACEIFAAGGMNQHGGSAGSDVHPIRFYGRRETEVAGASSERISGDATHTYEGGHVETVSSDRSTTIGGKFRHDVTGDHTLGIGGDARETVVGKKTTTTIGDHTVNVKATGAYAVNTAAGDQTFSPGTAKFKVATSRPDSIELSTNPSSHATKFEELQTIMNGFKGQLDALFALISTHVHPGIGVVSPTLTPLARPTTLDLSTAKTLITKIG